MGVLRRFLGALLLCAVALIATGFATGRLASVVTNGVSMQPTFSAGDLVVVMRTDRYDIGDVIAYRDDERGEVVLHRIVGGDDTAFEVRGDSNQSVDVVTPAADEMIGRQVLHLPEIGRWIGSPLAMALAAGVLIGIAGLLTLGRSGRPIAAGVDPADIDARAEDPTTGRSADGPDHLAPDHLAPDHLAPDHLALSRWRWWHALLIVADVAVVAGLVTAFLVPPTVVVPEPVPMHIGALSYGVDVPVSDAYPEGRIDTGDTAFLRIVDHVDVTFRYEGVAGVLASARLRLVLDAAGGWTTAMPLAPLTPVSAGGVVIRGTIDMVELREMLARVQDATGVTLTTVQLRVEAVVDPDPTSSGGVTPYRHEMWFRFDELGLDLAEASVVSPSLDGPVVAFSEPARHTVEAARDVGGVPRAARRWLVVTLLVLLAATVTAWPNAASRRRDRAGTHPAPPLHVIDQPPPPIPALALAPVTRVASVELPHTPLRVRLSSRDGLDEIAHRTGSAVLVRDDGWAAVVTDGAVHWWEPDGIPAQPPAWADRADRAEVPATPARLGAAVAADDLRTSEMRFDVLDLAPNAPSAAIDPVQQLQAQFTAPRQPLFPPRSAAAHTVRSTIDEIVAYLAEAPEPPGSSDSADVRPPAWSLEPSTRRSP